KRRETGEPLAKSGIEQQALRPVRIEAGSDLVGVPGGRMADAAEAAIAGDDLSFKHGLGAVAKEQIDVADDPRTDQGLAIGAACRHRRDAIDELDLADRAERLWTRCAIHRTRLDIDGCDNVVT